MWHKHVHRCSLMPTAVGYFHSVCVSNHQTSFLSLISYLIYSSGSLQNSFFLMMNTLFSSSVVCSWLTLAFPIISRGTLYFRPSAEVHFMLPQRLWKGCPIKDPRWDDNTVYLQYQHCHVVYHVSMCVFLSARWTAGPWEFCSMHWCTAVCRLTGPATPHSQSKSLKAVTAGPTRPQVKGRAVFVSSTPCSHFPDCLIWLFGLTSQ